MFGQEPKNVSVELMHKGTVGGWRLRFFLRGFGVVLFRWRGLGCVLETVLCFSVRHLNTDAYRLVLLSLLPVGE